MTNQTDDTTEEVTRIGQEIVSKTTAADEAVVGSNPTTSAPTTVPPTTAAPTTTVAPTTTPPEPPPLVKKKKEKSEVHHMYKLTLYNMNGTPRANISTELFRDINGKYKIVVDAMPSNTWVSIDTIHNRISIFTKIDKSMVISQIDALVEAGIVEKRATT